MTIPHAAPFDDPMRILYDRLLQDAQGLVLTVSAAADRLPPEASQRALLDAVLLRADTMLSDARSGIEALDAAAALDGRNAETSVGSGKST